MIQATGMNIFAVTSFTAVYIKINLFTIEMASPERLWSFGDGLSRADTSFNRVNVNSFDTFRPSIFLFVTWISKTINLSIFRSHFRIFSKHIFGQRTFLPIFQLNSTNARE